MQRTRDWRRAQKARIIRRVFRKERNCNWYTPNLFSDFVRWTDDKGVARHYYTWQDIFENRRQRASRMADNRTTCSGFCCGNPRRWFGELTRQEQRFLCE